MEGREGDEGASLQVAAQGPRVLFAATLSKIGGCGRAAVISPFSLLDDVFHAASLSISDGQEGVLVLRVIRRQTTRSTSARSATLDGSMDGGARRAELKDFLRAHRAAIPPEVAGFPRTARRLTRGLRREELASLAGVSLTWYTWLEQGREINVSAETLRRIARALRLTASDHAYLLKLAGLPAPRSSPFAEDFHVQAVVDGFTRGPAVALDSMFNVLAYNRIADIVFTFDAYAGPLANNHLARAFLDPARRRLYAEDWEVTTRRLVGIFRGRASVDVGRQKYDELVAALTRSSPEFLSIWSDQGTEPLSSTKTYPFEHPKLGRLTLFTVRLLFEGFGGFIAIILPADEPSATALARAASEAGARVKPIVRRNGDAAPRSPERGRAKKRR
jgi:transcriptional regulator with XRE-family HTH domain